MEQKSNLTQLLNGQVEILKEHLEVRESEAQAAKETLGVVVDTNVSLRAQVIMSNKRIAKLEKQIELLGQKLARQRFEKETQTEASRLKRVAETFERKLDEVNKENAHLRGVLEQLKGQIQEDAA